LLRVTGPAQEGAIVNERPHPGEGQVGAVEQGDGVLMVVVSLAVVTRAFGKPSPSGFRDRSRPSAEPADGNLSDVLDQSLGLLILAGPQERAHRCIRPRNRAGLAYAESRRQVDHGVRPFCCEAGVPSVEREFRAQFPHPQPVHRVVIGPALQVPRGEPIAREPGGAGVSPLESQVGPSQVADRRDSREPRVGGVDVLGELMAARRGSGTRCGRQVYGNRLARSVAHTGFGG
jgi:hypothetical protein